MSIATACRSRVAKWMLAVTIGVVAVGYISNGFVLVDIISSEYLYRNKLHQEIREISIDWPQDERDDRNYIAESDYWPGPVAFYMVNISVPFIVEVNVQYQSPFTVMQLDGHSWGRRCFGVFVPLIDFW